MRNLADFCVFVGELTKEYLIQEFVAQGHNMKGRMKKSIRYEIIAQSDFRATVRFYMLKYGLIQNKGIRADRIPYGNRPASAETSQYIEGLIEFAMFRFRVGTDEATNIAFAIARVHARTGMHTPNSARYSRTGERTGFIEAAQRKAVPKIKAKARRFLKIFFSFVIREYNGRVKSKLI